MKHLPVLCLAALVFCACQKTKTSPTRFIIAGEVNQSRDRSQQLPTNVWDDIKVDLNQDNRLDVAFDHFPYVLPPGVSLPFGAFYAAGATVDGDTSRFTEGIEAQSGDALNIQLSETVFHPGDTINRNVQWVLPYPAAGPYSAFALPILLAGHRPASDTTVEKRYDRWEGDNNYLAVRMIKGSDTLYGWIHVQTFGSYAVTVNKCALNK